MMTFLVDLILDSAKNDGDRYYRYIIFSGGVFSLQSAIDSNLNSDINLSKFLSAFLLPILDFKYRKYLFLMVPGSLKYSSYSALDINWLFELKISIIWK